MIGFDDNSIGIHDVCGLLKRYLVDLPERIIPPYYTKNFKLDDSNDDLYQKINWIIDQIPLVNKIILAQILDLLNLVTEHRDINKMNINNIATCWSLILFKEPEMNTAGSGLSKELLENVALLNKVLVVMLTHYENIKEDLREKLIDVEDIE